MSKTRFMSRLFSAVDEKDEELTKQVAGDIEEAKRSGSVEDDEVSYKHVGDGKVIATDKGTGEHTLIEQDPKNPEIYDLTHLPDEELARFLHPVEGQDGDPQVLPEGSMPSFNEEEKIEDHANEVCPGCNNPVGECCCEEDKKFSVTTDNQAVLRIFSDQVTVDHAAQIVTNTESPVELETMRFEKDDTDPNAVIVTDKDSGDKAKVVLDGDEMEVTELEQKNFRTFSKIEDNKMSEVIRRQKLYTHAEQFDPIFVVGIDTVNQVLVNSPVYTEEDANELAGKLMNMGLEGVTVIADPDQARDYAIQLLENNGVSSIEEQVSEEEAKEFSDHTLYINKFYTDRTQFMNKLFSEAEDGIDASQSLIESAIEEGEQIETEDEVITPINDSIAVVEDKDNGEFTKVQLDGDSMNVEAVSEEEADKLTAHLSYAPEEKKEDALAPVEQHKAFSQVEGTIELPTLSKLFSDSADSATETIEAVEDKAMEAVQAIQETAETAVQAIAEAKEAPVEGQQADIKEAQYSEKTFSDKGINSTSTLKSW